MGLLSSTTTAKATATRFAHQLLEAGKKATDHAVRSTITHAYVRSLERTWKRFVKAAKQPRQAQEQRLRRLIALGVNSDFGRFHRLEKVHSYSAYCEQVPIRSYEEFSPWIERICNGERGILSSAPVNMVELSGGTSLTNKFIPYTSELLAEFEAATNPWIFNLFSSFEGIGATSSYWSISPAMTTRRTTAGGLPIGFSDDTEYFSPLKRFALRKMMAVPNEVGRICDAEQWRLATLTYLVEAKSLGFISVWSPTFLSLLMESLEENLDAVLSRLSKDRADALRSAIARSGDAPCGEHIWPHLRVISCWTDGWAQNHVTALRRWFPSTPIQPKGLLATEGVVSFPIEGQRGSVLAVAGHFLEFIDLNRPGAPPLMAHELREGASYSPLLTTGGGLYRYHLKDVLRCVGSYVDTPLVRFEGKLDAVCDLFGEKLCANQVEAAVEHARRESGLNDRFALLCPTQEPRPHYRLFVETEDDDEVIAHAAAVLEDQLRRSHHYDYCRRLGQLGEMQVARVHGGFAAYTKAAMESGRRAGSLKPQMLDLHGLAHNAFPQAKTIKPNRATNKERAR